MTIDTPQPDQTPERTTSAKNVNVALKDVLIETAGLALFLAAVPAIAYFDVLVLGVPLREHSTTEVSQHLALFSCCILYALGSRKHPEKRGYLMMIAFFFLALLVREHNYYLNFVADGAWQILFLAVVAIGFFKVRRHTDTILQPLLTHFQFRGFGYSIAGLILLIFFSRFFGSGGMQRAVQGELYNSDYKMFIQEGTELLGYSLLLFGTIISLRNGFGQKK